MPLSSTTVFYHAAAAMVCAAPVARHCVPPGFFQNKKQKNKFLGFSSTSDNIWGLALLPGLGNWEQHHDENPRNDKLQADKKTAL